MFIKIMNTTKVQQNAIRTIDRDVNKALKVYPKTTSNTIINKKPPIKPRVAISVNLSR